VVQRTFGRMREALEVAPLGTPRNEGPGGYSGPSGRYAGLEDVGVALIALRLGAPVGTPNHWDLEAFPALRL